MQATATATWELKKEAGG